LPPKDFDIFVRLLQTNDRYPAASDRAEWPKQIWDVPVLTPMGAMLLGRFEPGPDGQPVQRDNCSVMMFLDEFNQIEANNQKPASTVVGAFSREVRKNRQPPGIRASLRMGAVPDRFGRIRPPPFPRGRRQ
jgi:hypothetical protein